MKELFCAYPMTSQHRGYPHSSHTEKDDSVHICVDMCLANQAIQRVRNLFPTIDDVSLDLNGA